MTMRVYFASAAALAVLAILAVVGLETAQRNVEQAFTSAVSVRLPDHGNTHNLVGRDWYSPTQHGWDNEIPTANSPTSLARKEQ
jgi:hypothetical protein